MKINGIEYDEKELDFSNIICDLEDVGIDVMGMNDGEEVKPFTLCRGAVSVITGNKNLKECGKLLTSHLKNGGTIDDIMVPFSNAMSTAGFGEASEETQEETVETPLKKVK